MNIIFATSNLNKLKEIENLIPKDINLNNLKDRYIFKNNLMG